MSHFSIFGALRLVFGSLLLVFGLQWPRKGICRVGATGLRDMGRAQSRRRPCRALAIGGGNALRRRRSPSAYGG